MTTRAKLLGSVRTWRAMGASIPVSLQLAWGGMPVLAGGADTEFGTGAAEAVKLWATEVWREAPFEMTWSRFIDKGVNAIIQEKTELEGKPGDQVTYTLSRKLTGQGVSGDADLEGNEEVMTPYSDAVVINQRRNAVRLKGKMSERRTAFNQRQEAKEHLKTWLAETLDNDVYSGMSSSPAASRIVYAGTATSVATLLTTTVITVPKIDVLVAKAKKADPKVWPVRIEGRDWFVMLLHTDVGYDLEQDSTWHATQRDAGVRGDENKIFTGRLGTWRGVIVHESEKVPVASNGGAAGDQFWASNMFLGKQAGVIAYGMKPEAWEKEFDYGNKVGFAIGAIWGFKKAVFQAVDHGYFEFRSGRTNN